jgi:hypothetical protein
MVKRGIALALLLLAVAAPLARAQSGPCAVGYLACGLDFSANAPSVPLSGYVLVATVPAAARSGVEVDNQSTWLIQVVRDDGFGNQPSSIMLAGAVVAGGQGGSWASTTFRGRVRVYAPSSTAQVAAYQE